MGSGTTLEPGGSASLPNAISLTTAATFLAPSGNILTITGAITGAVGTTLTTSGPGTIALTGNNSSYAGNIHVAQGTLGAGGTLTPLGTGSVSMANGTKLQAETSPTTVSNPISLTTAATFDTNGNSLTIGGVVSGSGATLTKIGTGTLTLSGANTYSGGTMISAGTLQAGATNTIPSTGLVTVSGGATFNLNSFNQTIGNLTGSGSVTLGTAALTLGDSTSQTFSGVMSGTGGSLIKQGSGTFTLTGANTYSGGTTVSAGILQGNTTSLQGNILDNASVVFNQSSTGTYSSVISGSGSLTMENTGTLTLTGANTYNGGTMVSAGTLQGTTTSLQGDITNDSTLIFNQNFTGTYSGTLSGTGTLDINGSGLVELTATSSTQAQTNVNAGTLAVNGTLNSPVTVFAGATLQGNGTVGNLTNSGIVSPGNSIGTLSVSGNYIQTGTGVYDVEVAPTSADLLAVTGSVALDPGASLMIILLGLTSALSSYTIVNGASISGTFTTCNCLAFPMFKFAIAYFPDHIDLVLEMKPASTIVTKGNAGAAATCFDAVSAAPGSDKIAVLGLLTTLPTVKSLTHAFKQMQPSQYAALPLAQENNGILVRSTLSQRLGQLYPTCPNPPPSVTADDPSPTISESENEPVSHHGGVWLEPVGKYVAQDNQQQNLGFHAASGGAIAGTDYEILPKTYVGGAVAYTFTNLDWHHSAGNARINSYYGALYGSWFYNRAFVEWTGFASHNHYDTSRRINFSTLHRNARGKHNGYQLGSSLGTGALFNFGCYQLQPYARADYMFMHQKGFKEHGADSINLSLENKNSRYIRTDLGLKFERRFNFYKSSLIPFIKASWIWEKQLDHGHLEAHFKDSGCQFRVTGLHPIRSLFAPSVGLTTLAYKDAFAFSFYYDAEMGKNVTESRGYVSFEYRY